MPVSNKRGRPRKTDQETAPTCALLLAAKFEFQEEDYNAQGQRNEVGEYHRQGVDSKAINDPERYPDTENDKHECRDVPGRARIVYFKDLGQQGQGCHGSRDIAKQCNCVYVWSPPLLYIL
jgi:hypothetical protein